MCVVMNFLVVKALADSSTVVWQAVYRWTISRQITISDSKTLLIYRVVLRQLGALHKSLLSAVNFFISVRMFACISSPPTGRIFG